MADTLKTGTDWQDEELDAIVADYFAMLALDAAGQRFVKAHRARALMERTGRSHRSVEFKHMNISAVAAELGLPIVRGYRPLTNYQSAIFDAIDRHLDAHPEVLSDDAYSLLPVAQRWGGGASPLGDVTEGATRSFRGVAEPTRPSMGATRTSAPSPSPKPLRPARLAPRGQRASPASSANTTPPSATIATAPSASWARNTSSTTNAPA